MRHTLTASILLVSVLATLMVAAGPQSKEPAWTHYLVEVTNVERDDPPARLREQHDALVAESAAAEDPQRRKTLEHEITRLKNEMTRRSGYIIMGWSRQSSAREIPINSTVSMKGFYVKPSAAAHKALADFKPGTFVVMPRAGTRELFWSGGRGWISANRLQAARKTHAPGELKGMEPTPASSPDAIDSVELNASFQKIKEGSKNRTYRHWVRIKAPSPPADANTLHLWLRYRPVDVRGEPLGPIPAHVAIDRSESGSFGQSRSWEVHLPDRLLDPEALTVEIVAVEWR